MSSWVACGWRERGWRDEGYEFVQGRGGFASGGEGVGKRGV